MQSRVLGRGKNQNLLKFPRLALKVACRLASHLVLCESDMLETSNCCHAWLAVSAIIVSYAGKKGGGAYQARFTVLQNCFMVLAVFSDQYSDLPTLGLFSHSRRK